MGAVFGTLVGGVYIAAAYLLFGNTPTPFVGFICGSLSTLVYLKMIHPEKR